MSLRNPPFIEKDLENGNGSMYIVKHIRSVKPSLHWRHGHSIQVSRVGCKEKRCCFLREDIGVSSCSVLSPLYLFTVPCGQSVFFFLLNYWKVQKLEPLKCSRVHRKWHGDYFRESIAALHYAFEIVREDI